MSILANSHPGIIDEANGCPGEDWDDYGRYLAERVAAGMAGALERFEQLTKTFDAIADRLAVNAADPMKFAADRRAWKWSADAYRDCAKMVRDALARHR
jgi:hypothetical protein